MQLNQHEKAGSKPSCHNPPKLLKIKGKNCGTFCESYLAENLCANLVLFSTKRACKSFRLVVFRWTLSQKSLKISFYKMCSSCFLEGMIYRALGIIFYFTFQFIVAAST